MATTGSPHLRLPAFVGLAFALAGCGSFGGDSVKGNDAGEAVKANDGGVTTTEAGPPAPSCKRADTFHEPFEGGKQIAGWRALEKPARTDASDRLIATGGRDGDGSFEVKYDSKAEGDRHRTGLARVFPETEADCFEVEVTFTVRELDTPAHIVEVRFVNGTSLVLAVTENEELKLGQKKESVAELASVGGVVRDAWHTAILSYAESGTSPVVTATLDGTPVPLNPKTTLLPFDRPQVLEVGLAYAYEEGQHGTIEIDSVTMR